ncbi:MAG: hypothetical protein ACJAYU_002878 [Bradymonadia bacterium]|jgi:hypothetical protein
MSLGVFNAIPILVGIVAGLLLGSPHRPKGADSVLSRGLFALGLASLGGAAFSNFEHLQGWALSIAASLVAVGYQPGLRGGRLMAGVAASAAFIALGFAAAFAAGEAAVSFWVVEDVWVTAMASGIVGASGYLAASVSEVVAPRHTGSEPLRIAVSADAERVLDERVTDSAGDFQAQWDDLARTAGGVTDLLDRLEECRPDDALLIDEVRLGVCATISGARRGLSRWELVDREAENVRVTRLEERVCTNRDALLNEADLAVSATIEATVARQERALTALKAVDSSRRTFSFRLEEAEASLEVLRLQVERALTAGDELDHAEVDSLVDALGEAHALFSESEVVAAA